MLRLINFLRRRKLTRRHLHLPGFSHNFSDYVSGSYVLIVGRTLACRFRILEAPVLIPFNPNSIINPLETTTVFIPLASGRTAHLLADTTAAEYLSEMLQLLHVWANPCLLLLLSTLYHHVLRFHLNS